jgi:hypothetical protein
MQIGKSLAQGAKVACLVPLVYKNTHPLFLSSLSTYVTDYANQGMHISKYHSIL